MGTLVQLVRTDPENVLILFGFNEKGELVFKSSRTPKYLQNEKIVIEKDMVYTNLYNFHIHFLRHFINQQP